MQTFDLKTLVLIHQSILICLEPLELLRSDLLHFLTHYQLQYHSGFHLFVYNTSGPAIKYMPHIYLGKKASNK